MVYPGGIWKLSKFGSRIIWVTIKIKTDKHFAPLKPLVRKYMSYIQTKRPQNFTWVLNYFIENTCLEENFGGLVISTRDLVTLQGTIISPMVYPGST